ncbi:LacI family DNA-binding transcriptional regulator [Arthrobacter sp. NPDC058130]|uniref:LacI family DNA-binding transcriptional regulator n=1 Tax=Arthrobacter sp. NPDC058130 TaxID=3346353 RepID=UPI0036E54DB2
MTTTSQSIGRSRVTLSRVAEEGGVSVSTASKVLNGRSGVGADTRRAIEEVAERLGYIGVGERERPQRGSREPLIEVVVDSLRNPYTLALLCGAVQAAENAELAIVTRSLSAIEKETSLKWAQRLARGGRIGVIEVTSEFSVERVRALQTVGLPFVLVDPLEVPRMSLVSVGATNWAGGMEATRHLIELGHVDIAYIGGPSGADCDVARTHGYQAAMQQAGLPIDLTEVVHGPFTFEQGLAAGTEVLGRPVPPTAIFAASDVTAMGVLEAARTLGISVPGQLSIVGFDNTLLAHTSSPRLTTIHQPVEEIGQTAVETVQKLARGEVLPSKRVELATHLVIRDSTAPPPSLGGS